MKYKNYTIHSFSLICGLLVTAQAYAQVAPKSGQVDVGRQSELLQAAPSVEPEKTQPSIPTAAPQQTLPENGPVFTLTGVDIIGATAISPELLKKTYQEFIGKSITVIDMRAIVTRITQLYRDQGFALSQATLPSQDVNNGVLHIAVIEGYIRSVRFEGALKDQSSRSLLDDYGAHIMADKPLHMATLERYLLLMNDLSGATARSIMTGSSTVKGAYDLTIATDIKPIQANASIDNRGTKFFGPMEYQTEATSNGNLGLNESITVRALTTSPTTELRFGDVLIQVPIDSDGTKLIATGSSTGTNPGNGLQISELHGDAKFGQLQIEHPFIRSRNENLALKAGVDYRSADSDNFKEELSKDRIWSARASGTYDTTDSLNGATIVNTELSRGLNIFNATSDESEFKSRGNADGEFTKITGDATRTQALPANFSLQTALTGQYAFDRLLSSEEFALGGSGLGEAYDASEISGDNGLEGRIELRWNQSVGLPYLSGYQLFSSYELGTVWIRSAAPGIDSRMSLASWAAGVRMNFTPWLSGTSELAVPLTRPVATEHNNDMRIFFSLAARYN